MTTGKLPSTWARNITVLSYKKKILARSNISFMFVNKDTDKPTVLCTLTGCGVDFNLAAKTTKGQVKYFIPDFTTDYPDGQYAQGASVKYSKGNILSAWTRRQ